MNGLDFHFLESVFGRSEIERIFRIPCATTTGRQDHNNAGETVDEGE